MSPLLPYYCLLILAASIVGGMVPSWIQLTHRWMECLVSFVAGVMLGVGLLHMLPHAALAAIAAEDGATGTEAALFHVMLWLIAGFLLMFFVERFFCFHHHEAPFAESQGDTSIDVRDDGHHHTHHSHTLGKVAIDAHVHDITWGGACFGLTVHSILAGVALAASVQHGGHGTALAGFGTFLVIVLHKPFDAMTITMLMARGGWSPASRNVVNGLFALAIPVGAVVFNLGLMPAGESTVTQSPVVAYALAFSAGTFLCISMSDLLPELQFHQHDRVKLSVALLVGLLTAYAAGRLEMAAGHQHGDANSPQALNLDDAPRPTSRPRFSPVIFPHFPTYKRDTHTGRWVLAVEVQGGTAMGRPAINQNAKSR